MAAILVRNLDDGVQQRIKQRAVDNNRSMEAEARAILTAAVADVGFVAAWRPSTVVLDWLASIDETAAITAVSVAEILREARLLPHGRRRDDLVDGIGDTLRAFRGDILEFDERAARVYAEPTESHVRAGVPSSVEDGMIDATCRTHGATLATRNVRHFEGLGIDVVDPWGTR